MGVSIRERVKGSGEWFIFIRHNGLRTSRKIGDKDTAEKVKERIEAKILLGEFSVSRPDEKQEQFTFKQISAEWMNNHVSHLAASTRKRYKTLFDKHILPRIGATPVNEIKRMDVILLLEGMIKKGLSHGTAALAKNVISGVMERAIDMDLVGFNPTSKVLNKLTRKKVEKDVDVFTSEEVEHILSTCKNWKPEYYPFFLCAFRTGMRLGELLGLDWSDINWKDDYIRVQRSYKNRTITTTKNKKNRSVDLSPLLKMVLEKEYRAEKKAALMSGREVRQPIFVYKGERIAQNSVRNIWKRLLEKSGYEYRKLHITRHTFGALMVSANVPLNAVKEQMGHHSIKITVDVYGKFIKSGEGVTAILDNYVAPNGTQEREKVLNQ